jgi:uncharacterized protein (DUF433 family)
MEVDEPPGEDAMKPAIEIVDRGRGPQLSTNRITVQDLVPYLQRNCTYEQIQEIMPVLTFEEIRAVERYVQENHEAVMEQDRRIRQRNAERSTPPGVQEILQRGGDKMTALREEFRRKRAEGRNGDQAPR